MQQELASPLPLVVQRLAIGITSGVSLLALFFTVWALVSDSTRPVIGAVVFQSIAWVVSSLFFITTTVIRRVEHI